MRSEWSAVGVEVCHPERLTRLKCAGVNMSAGSGADKAQNWEEVTDWPR